MAVSSRILRSFLLASLSLAAVSGRPLEQAEDALTWDKPWFCHDLDCPHFSVVNSTEVYQTREYEAGYWAVTHVDSLLYSEAVARGFKRLFNYISGENEEGKKIAMTAPVATKIVPGQGPFCKSHFTVAFYVPDAMQDAPIKPTNGDVQITMIPKFTAFVYQYGGFVVEDHSLFGKAKRLHDELEKDGVATDADKFITASYDPPFRLQHRHNEIMLLAAPSNALDLLS